MGRKINYHLRKAAESRKVTQTQIARELNYAQSTVNGYFNGDPAPCEFIDSVAVLLDDSDFNVSMGHEHYGLVPNMETDVYQENVVALEIIQVQQSEERKARKMDVLLILAKNDRFISDLEKLQLEAYAMEFLDEILVEMKMVMLILAKCGKSLMTATRERKTYWKQQGFIRR